MDKIRIENLEIFAKHGVFPEENFLGQKFVLSAVLHTDTRKAGLTDELSYSVHYGEVSHLIKKVVEENTWKLLETVAEATAKAILLSYPMVSQVDLTIKKPWAPIGLPLDTVSVEISRGWHTAYIALGSNMGDKEKYLNEAVEKLQQTSDCQVLKVSDFLVTAPYGGVEQDDFLNGALALKTLLTPQELLERLHEIEQEAHRERLIHWGPRTLDLDILLYDDLVLDTPDLIIPHVEMHLRDFVLIHQVLILLWILLCQFEDPAKSDVIILGRNCAKQPFQLFQCIQFGIRLDLLPHIRKITGISVCNRHQHILFTLEHRIDGFFTDPQRFRYIIHRKFQTIPGKFFNCCINDFFSHFSLLSCSHLRFSEKGNRETENSFPVSFIVTLH